MPTAPVFELDAQDQAKLAQLRDLEESRLLELLRDLRQERDLELRLYQSREQWFWVPWTTCLAATVASLISTNAAVSAVVPFLLGTTAIVLGKSRLRGLRESLAIIDQRHKWTVEITRLSNAGPRLWALSFEDRVARTKSGFVDDRHHRSFWYPEHAVRLTPYLWGAFWLLGLLRSFQTLTK